MDEQGSLGCTQGEKKQPRSDIVSMPEHVGMALENQSLPWLETGEEREHEHQGPQTALGCPALAGELK